MKNIKGANLYLNLRKGGYCRLKFGDLEAKITMVGKTGVEWFGLAIEAPREIIVKRGDVDFSHTGSEPESK